MPFNEPISCGLGPDAERDLEKFVWNQVTSLKESYKVYHTEKVAKWRRLYRGIPKTESRNFPWKDASNVIIQLIGQNVDDIRARILGTIFEVMPLWVTGLIGEWKSEERVGEQQEVIHQFLNYVGLEPEELDLFRVESQGIDEQVKFGTVVYKLPWLKDMEAEVVGQVEGSNGSKVEFNEFIKYEGPRPEKLEWESWAATITANRLEDADFKYHIIRLKKWQLLDRKKDGVYKLNDDDWTSLLASPDRPGLSDEQKQKLQAEGKPVPPDGYDSAEWDIYECWFPFRHNGKKLRLIYSYHYQTKKKLRCIYNFYPKNEEPWEMGRFGYTDDGLLGYGLCEMLEHYQEEVSTNHNQRVDNRTLGNTSIIRIDPNSKLDAIFSIYPNALVPALEGEIEKIQLGANYPSSVAEEELTLRLARERCGTNEPGMQAAGGGTVGKRGYSSMGTFSVLQAGNRRVNLNITDARYTHLKLGRKFLNQYSYFGIGERDKIFGEQAQLLTQALENIRKGRIVLPIRAATASINKELEKQNDMLLTQVMQRHHMGISQILQAVNNPAIPPEIKKFLVGWIESSSIVMSRILRNFGFDDVSRLLPERQLLKGASNNGNSNAGSAETSGQSGGNAGQASSASTVEQGSGQESSQLPTTNQIPGMGTSQGVPQRVV